VRKRMGVIIGVSLLGAWLAFLIPNHLDRQHDPRISGPAIGEDGHFVGDAALIGCPTAKPWEDYESRRGLSRDEYWVQVTAPAGCMYLSIASTFKVRDSSANLTQACWPSGLCLWVDRRHTESGPPPATMDANSAPEDAAHPVQEAR
jgi:hypothetical protein